MPELDPERARKLRKRWVRLKEQPPMPPAVRKALTIGVIICVVVGIATVLLILSKMPNRDVELISQRDAYMTAFRDSGAEKKEVTFEVFRLEDEESPLVYYVYFYDNENYYKYIINAETGDIEKKEVLDGGGPRYQDKEGTTEDIEL
jgi:hypothetical protein